MTMTKNIIHHDQRPPGCWGPRLQPTKPIGKSGTDWYKHLPAWYKIYLPGIRFTYLVYELPAWYKHLPTCYISLIMICLWYTAHYICSFCTQTTIRYIQLKQNTRSERRIFIGSLHHYKESKRITNSLAQNKLSRFFSKTLWRLIFVALSG